jgi:exodeoxyribonuclease VII small subunit
MPKSKPWDYESAIAEIEAIITHIESGELGLAEVFEKFQLATTRLQECKKFLAEKQQQMQLLIEQLDPEEP